AVRGEPGRAVLHAGALHRAAARPAAGRPGARLLLGGRGVPHVLAAARPGHPAAHPDHGLAARSLPERPAVPVEDRRPAGGRGGGGRPTTTTPPRGPRPPA